MRGLFARTWWEQTLLSPEIHEWLHRLDLLISNEIEQLADVDKMNEACVELLVCADVPEWIKPVTMVDVCVASHHLTIDALDI